MAICISMQNWILGHACFLVKNSKIIFSWSKWHFSKMAPPYKVEKKNRLRFGFLYVKRSGLKIQDFWWKLERNPIIFIEFLVEKPPKISHLWKWLIFGGFSTKNSIKIIGLRSNLHQWFCIFNPLLLTYGNPYWSRFFSQLYKVAPFWKNGI